MQITDMLNQYNRTIANGTEISSGTQGIRQIASSLQQLAVGNVFEGSISHMENGIVTLGLSDGKTIQARLDSGVSVRVGESMFFQVRSNNGTQIAIRPFAGAGGMNPALLNALKAASLPANDKMVTMVNSMMEQAMPIDKQSLVQMAKLVAGNGRMDTATIVQMAKLGIPVTEEMAAQFENYKSDQYAILDQLESAMEAIPERLAHGSENGKAFLELNRQMIHVLLGETEAAGDENVMQQAKGQVQNADGVVKAVLQPETAGQSDTQSGMQTAGEEGVPSNGQVAGEEGAQPGMQPAGKESVQPGVQSDAEMGIPSERQAEDREAGIQKGAQKAASDEPLQEGAVNKEKGHMEGTKVTQQTVSAEGTAGFGTDKSETNGIQPDTLKNLFHGAELQQLSDRLIRIPELSQNPAVFADGALVSDLASKELLQLLGQAFSSKNPFSRQALSELASSKEYRALIRNVMEQQWLLKPEELKGEHKVSELYERLDRQMAQMEKVLKAFGQNTPQLSDTASNVRSNIQFMNQLNQTYAYVQIPLKLAGQNAHSDLYVYTDKRKKREKGDELTAFLHLDLDHLGSTDVSIKLRSRQVATDFYLADDISYQLLSRHIELLKKRLLEKGYQAKIHISNQEEKVNFVEDLLKQGTPSAGGMVHRYSFDVRA